MNKNRFRNKDRWKDTDGYTIIEIMIAVLILSVGILGIMSMQISSIRANSWARHLTESATLCADQFEKMMPMSYNDADLTPATTTTRTEGKYTIQRVVSAENIPVNNMKTITVTVSWAEAGQQRRVSHEYYKAR
jgi:type IV pilus assembly protein PilV